jgi:membrane protease YdiL (CAAX protease family)
MRNTPQVSAVAPGTPVVTPKSAHRGLWMQLAVTLLLFEGTLWSGGHTQQFLFCCAVIWVLSTAFRRFKTADLGLTSRGLRQCAWVLPAAALAGFLATLTAWIYGGLHGAFGPRTSPSQYAAYACWAMFQQFVLQSYFFTRLESGLQSGRAVVLSCASLFSLLHIPNPALMLATFFAGLFFCELFRRHRNLYSLGVAHAILGLSLAAALPPDLHHNMRVGRGFFHDDSPKSNSSSLSPPVPIRTKANPRLLTHR